LKEYYKILFAFELGKITLINLFNFKLFIDNILLISIYLVGRLCINIFCSYGPYGCRCSIL